MSKGYEDFFKKARAQHQKSVELTNEQKIIQAAKQRIRHGRKQKSKGISWSTVGVCIVGLVAMAWSFLNAHEIEKFVDRVEVGWLTTASAAADKATSPAKSESQNKGDDKTAESEAEAGKNVKKLTPEEMDHLSKLTLRSQELDVREEETRKQEAELQKMKADLEKRLKELEVVRSEISTMLADRVKVDEQKVDTLVQVYSNMKPPQAAKVFETMDIDLAVQIMAKMKKKNAADIMNLMKPEKAQLFSEKYAGYKR